MCSVKVVYGSRLAYPTSSPMTANPAAAEPVGGAPGMLMTSATPSEVGREQQAGAGRVLDRGRPGSTAAR